MSKRPTRRLEVEIAPGVVLARLPDGSSVVELYDDAKNSAPLDRERLTAWIAVTTTAADVKRAGERAAGTITVDDLIGFGRRVARAMDG